MEITQRILEIIKQDSGIDVTLKTRHRDTIEMRSLYCHVVKEIHPKKTLKSIGDSLNLNHATVIHSLKQYELYEHYSPHLKVIKKRILSTFLNPDPDCWLELIDRINTLLINTRGTEQNKNLQIRLEALYDMNKTEDKGWYAEDREKRMNIIGQNGNDGEHYN